MESDTITNADWLRVADLDQDRLRYVLRPEGETRWELEVALNGTAVKERGALYPSPHTKLWISDAYDDAEVLADRLNLILSNQVPERLRQAAERTFILGAYANEPTGEAGAACTEGRDLFVWRLANNNDRPELSRFIINHELAHAAGHDGGPPSDIQEAWDEARELDEQHTARLASEISGGDTSRGEFKVTSKTRLLLGSPWITARSETYASEGQKEDWACAVEFYANWDILFHDGKMSSGGRDFAFADIYPHRARLIKDFLGQSTATGGNAPIVRP